MATKLYFHAAANGLSGTFPSGEQSTAAASWTATGADTLRKMDQTIGTEQTSLAGSSLASTSLQLPFMGFFRSLPLSGSQTVGGAAKNFRLNIAAAESHGHLQIGESLSCHIYVWRPSTGTKVGSVFDGPGAMIAIPGVAAPGVSNTEKVNHGAFTAGTTQISALDGDVVICEIWPATQPISAAVFTGTFYFDGTTENTTLNATVSNHASFLELDDTLAFRTPTIAATPSSTNTATAGLTVSPGAKANAVCQATQTASLTALIRLAATRASQAGATASLTALIELRAGLAGQSAATGTLLTQIRAQATLSNQVSASAGLTTLIPLKAGLQSQTSASAGLFLALLLQTAGQCQSAASAALLTQIRAQASLINLGSAMATLDAGSVPDADFSLTAAVLTSAAVSVPIETIVASATTSTGFSATANIAV